MITVTQPLMPDFDEFTAAIRQLWDSRMLTNNATFHKELEEALCRYLGVEYISLYTNGTLPIIAALKALNIKGEVITTPYSFVATSHAIEWCGLTPVFADIDPATGNLDPKRAEERITEKTAAILPVHVYGNPCDTASFDALGRRYGLKVIYDAAHAFGVNQSGKSILLEGDISTLSFHATKVFNTLEGGAVVCHSREMKHRLDNLRNFGFRGETCVEEVGINGKMDEIRAIFGLLNLKKTDEAIAARRQRYELYCEQLAGTAGIEIIARDPKIRHNYYHFPIKIDTTRYKHTRDELYSLLLDHGYYSRRYFYPLITDFAPYSRCAGADRLPNARRLADSVLCLPLYHDLAPEHIKSICELIKK